MKGTKNAPISWRRNFWDEKNSRSSRYLHVATGPFRSTACSVFHAVFLQSGFEQFWKRLNVRSTCWLQFLSFIFFLVAFSWFRFVLVLYVLMVFCHPTSTGRAANRWLPCLVRFLWIRETRRLCFLVRFATTSWTKIALRHPHGLFSPELESRNVPGKNQYSQQDDMWAMKKPFLFWLR